MALTRKQLPTYEFSPEGFKKIKDELEKLTKDRVGAVENLSKARAMGDLSENGFYKESRAKLSSIDSRINRLNLMIKYAKVITKENTGGVGFGSKVTVKIKGKEREFEIVGREESNPMEGKLSKDSPIGRVLIGKREGDKVLVRMPAGEMECEIVSVE